ncbi:cilia- and flagella-associated protein 45 [Diachasma alloeum]|uniref:cilia- and flagella-associated protein 45 n=1 Tax=Diachasma alloeum TaxID=454923 RepID=UPI00073843E8|nr:cilia- and flagella-associated protein 45 [Diachasma alloeum]
MAKNPVRTVEKNGARATRVSSGSRISNGGRGSTARANSAPSNKSCFNVKDSNRQHRIPCEKIPQNLPKSAKIITKSEYDYFRTRALDGLQTKEEKEAALLEVENERARLLAESMARKEEIRRLDLAKGRDKPLKLDDLEAEARRKTMHLLERAYDLKLEQEEEIQMCNRLILETKCRAIRDLQVSEKKIIERELNEEEKRLNQMMEKERKQKLEEEARRDELEMARRRKYARLLRNQILENEEQKIIEFERKQEEGKLINLSNIAWQDEEIAKARRKEEEAARVRKQLISENEKLMRYKQMEREEQRILDLRIREYQKKKAEREAAQAEEQRLAKARKDRERSRMAAQTQQATELQSQIDELNAARVQEEVEREWRRKEKEAALKRLETRKALAMAREDQIKYRKMLQAMEIERERREFQKILQYQKEAICREQGEREERRKEALNHRTIILQQVNEKERGKREMRRKMVEEGMAIRAEMEMRKKRLREAMEKKCKEMSANNVPEVYINEVKAMIDKVK